MGAGNSSASNTQVRQNQEQLPQTLRQQRNTLSLPDESKPESKLETTNTQHNEKDHCEKKNLMICISCSSQFNQNHLGIKCPQNHFICQECSKVYINSMFSNPHENMPPLCSVCKVKVITNTIQMLLDTEQSEHFNNLMLCFVIFETEFSDKEIIIHCPFCKYYEIRDKSGVNFVFCSNINCKKRSCYYCHLECPYNNNKKDHEDNQDDGEENDEDDFQDPDARKHFVCAELNETRKKIEKAIEDGSKVYCPDCGLGGRKDDACTHMACVKCKHVYCYFCGQSEETCDKERNITHIYGHNSGWPTNENRCPMYLSELNDYDERWPENDDECLDFFHRIKVISNLRKVIQENDANDIKRVEEKYKCIQNSGFTIEQILNEDLTLINRS
ncbi:potential E3 ubiquitin-protein ligase ariadne-2-like [Hydra vulgaris]|uniref:Potential E3 ubiquitin-protein ligase ariadne-2-like n=1 Tax=Hydra vulgaris TaxID=6087 RepID=A0ABM4DFT9_HYDVU